MSITVGLDFGTHQTKVCIENAANPAQKLYEFVEFLNSSNQPTVLFPSIVQINNDDTISYGFVNDKECKTIEIESTIKPKMEILPEPVLKLPDKPLKSKYPLKPTEEKKGKITWKEQLQKLKSNELNNNSALQNWKDECKMIDRKHDEMLEIWGENVKIVEEKYKSEVYLWNKKTNELKQQYNKKINEWELNRKVDLNFRYFKLASFSGSNHWNHQINPDIICVLYIAHILFILQEKLGEEFFLQMGIPSGINDYISKAQQKKAYTILVAAYKIVELYQTKESFHEEKYYALIEMVDNSNYTEDDILRYGLNVLPEAYAGLSSITQQKRLETGMSLLVDIGGGTTDIAFFTIWDNQPDIHAVISLPKGLNYIFEQYMLINRNKTISDVQQLFFHKQGRESLFRVSINKYKEELLYAVNQMVQKIQESFDLRKEFHNLDTSKLKAALKNRPVIFCGGGALYSSMHTSFSYFTDLKLINKNLLNIPFVLNQNIDDDLYTILATSFGLSIPLENDVVLTPIEKVFNHIIDPDVHKNDYNYEHGMSDT